MSTLLIARLTGSTVKPLRVSHKIASGWSPLSPPAQKCPVVENQDCRVLQLKISTRPNEGALHNEGVALDTGVKWESIFVNLQELLYNI